jgi:2-polyprenyl-3-methyl-5-hydroxy-6-metoxy-1,4-benzoquinol methylase
MTKYLTNDFEALHLVEGSLDLLQQIPDYANITKHHSMFEDFTTPLKFDTIIMSHVLEHIEQPIPVLQRIKTWLAKEGVLIISVPNARSLHRIVAVKMGLLKTEHTLNERDHALGHYRVYDTETLCAHIQKAGFKILDKGGSFLKPLSNNQIEQYWTPEMVEGFFEAGKEFPENCAEIFVVCTQ